jgi:hypothetical protein
VLPLRTEENTIRTHPGLEWKALNVRKHRGLGGNADEG